MLEISALARLGYANPYDIQTAVGESLIVNDDRKPEIEERSWLDRLTHFISGEPQTKSDLEDVLSLAEEHEIIDQDARKIMEGALLVTNMQVRDIMIPRAQMIVIDSDESVQEALPKIIDAGHSRFPVIGDGIDDVIGILLAKDLLPLVESDSAPPALRQLMRPVIAVPESKRLNVLLREFRQNRNHMAIVIDEYGGIAGLITIEDVLEEIVGEIEDETDVAEKKPIRPMSDGTFFVEALTRLTTLTPFLIPNSAMMSSTPSAALSSMHLVSCPVAISQYSSIILSSASSARTSVAFPVCG